jgi:hypothetical protein
MPTPANEESLRIKRLTYAKYLLRSANLSLRSPSPLLVAEGLLRLHDSVEIFQSAVLDRIGVPKNNHRSFIEFWVIVKEKQYPEPPYKDRFRALNDLRNNFKHHALLPNPEEIRELASVVPEFFEKVCRDIFAFDFVEISLANLMPEGELRNGVKAAERFTEAKDHDGAVTELAIAMERMFETIFPNISWDNPWSSLFQYQKVSYEEMLLRSGELGGKAVRAIDNSLDEIGSQIQEIRTVVSLVAWGVDLRDYGRFRRIAPFVHKSRSGEFECSRREEITLTDDDADFCLQFVIDTALKVEARRLAPSDAPSA